MEVEAINNKKPSKINSINELSIYYPTLFSDINKASQEACQSYGLRYDALSTQIYNDVIERLQLSSMAWESKYSYARITHRHDYSLVDAKVFYGPDSSRSDLTNTMIQLGVIELTNDNVEKKLRICVPEVVFQRPKTYRIGEVKLVHISSDNAAQELEEKGYTESFGWVIPDGKSYKKSDHPEAYELYKGSSATDFNVPTLTGFFRLNPGIQTTNAMQSYSYHNSDVQHNHQIQQTTSLGTVDMRAELVLSSLKVQGSDFAVHCGSLSRSSGCSGNTNSFSEAPNNGIVDLNNSNNITRVVGVHLYQHDGHDEESYPTHDTVVAVLYIGAKEE